MLKIIPEDLKKAQTKHNPADLSLLKKQLEGSKIGLLKSEGITKTQHELLLTLYQDNQLIKKQIVRLRITLLTN